MICHLHPRLEIVAAGQLEFQIGADEYLRRTSRLDDDRGLVARIANLVEANRAEPSRRRQNILGEPHPILFGVAVDLAVRLDDDRSRDQQIMNAARMQDPPRRQDWSEVTRDPLIAEARRRANSGWVIAGENAEIAERAAGVFSGRLNDLRQFPAEV